MNKHDEAGSGRAFEYVSGTLSAKERKDYEAHLASSEEERALVKFWQEHLLALDKQAGEIPPDPDTWQKIATTIGVREKPRAGKSRAFLSSIWLAWSSAAVAVIVLVAVLVKPLLGPIESIPNADYIAVLTDTSGEAVLTALTTAENNLMWLEWDVDSQESLLANSSEDSSLQLWAISRRDGQVRSLAIFNDVSRDRLTLDEAGFRLVTDASFLLLTREEAGGSAIDEPSEELIARGVCVRFKGDKV